MATASKITSSLFAALAVVSLTGCAAMCRNFGCSDCGPVGGCASCDECSGCGELYVDPWINHPADCCDPCDTCGNYNGQSCGTCRPLFAGIGTLWGYRNPACAPCDECVFPSGCDTCGVADCTGCEPACGCEPGCGCDLCVAEPACGCEPGYGCDLCIAEPACGCEPGCGCQDCVSGVVTGGDAHVVGQPTYSDEVVELEPPYRPHRTRKIFRPKARVAEGGLNINQY